MIEFFNKLFGRQASGATAKERLRLVLMSDHLSLAPEMIDAMKRDLVDVISRYVEVDREKIDVHFEHQDKALAMLANIPITGVNRSGSDGSGGNGHAEASKGAETVEAAAAICHAEVGASHPEVSKDPERVEGTTHGTTTPRRRKRRKGGQHHGGNAPQTGSPAPAT